ncbi:hypothetical protein BCEP4_590022 [Burkholderia cepacia]|nr:hypothetical protein BCEP4_590022 [Burkholderia cepacia]
MNHISAKWSSTGAALIKVMTLDGVKLKKRVVAYCLNITMFGWQFGLL